MGALELGREEKGWMRGKKVEINGSWGAGKPKGNLLTHESPEKCTYGV